ncbi:MAG: hypothetical protein JSR17_00100 [Proteobacteria bacterium]|nr:hypothetical protein [Pseudomonadota bacterium]
MKQSGPTNESHQETSHSHTHHKQHTAFSKFIGAAAGAGIEQGLLHGVDTSAKFAMANHTSALAWIKHLVASEGIPGATARLYNGFGLALLKKGPMRVYKYGVQDELLEKLDESFGDAADEKFGPYGHSVLQGVAGAITGIMEPFVGFQVPDTLQVRQQARKNKAQKVSITEDAKNLGLRGLFRGSVVTGFGRNMPGAVGLFGGSAAANQAMGNEDHHSVTKNLAAKWFGAFLSLIASQPGDVVKTKMQVEQKNLIEVLKTITPQQLFTSGLLPRLAMSAKVGLGFFVIEGCMNWAKEHFGEKVESSTKVRDEALAPSKSFTAQFNAAKDKSKETTTGEAIHPPTTVDEIVEKMAHASIRKKD